MSGGILRVDAYDTSQNHRDKKPVFDSDSPQGWQGPYDVHTHVEAVDGWFPPKQERGRSSILSRPHGSSRLSAIDLKYGPKNWVLTSFFFVWLGLEVWALIRVYYGYIEIPDLGTILRAHGFDVRFWVTVEYAVSLVLTRSFEKCIPMAPSI